MIKFSNLVYSLKKEVPRWFDSKTRKEYVENFGWGQLTYDIFTLFILLLATVVWYILYIPLGVLLLVSWLVAFLIEEGASRFSISVNKRWRKRAYFKMILKKERE